MVGAAGHPGVLWVPFGPFVMAGMGWCALRPGRWPRLLPLLPVAVSATLVTLPTDSWGRPGHTRDVVHHLLGYVGGLTVLPWLLGHGIARLTRALRAPAVTGPDRIGRALRTCPEGC
ncbi:hypothetical protein GCM10010264_15060 [Streptomyces globisporus]|nr:hypothetical protein GCM10010264_15060 [Streptomyces globisporus]